jgi:hypothetical protein
MAVDDDLAKAASILKKIVPNPQQISLTLQFQRNAWTGSSMG